MKGLFKSRTTLGIASIVLALILSFGITPLINKKNSAQIEVIRANKKIIEGQEITPDMISKVKVGSLNLPIDIIVDENEILNKFAKVDIHEGDYFFKDKITDIEKFDDHYLNNNYDDNIAISVTIDSLASGLSAKLKEGDIVTALVREEDEDPQIIQELMYLKVLATTTNKGIDKEDAEEGNVPNTVTLSVNDIQAEILTKYELDGQIHLALVFRGEAEKANKYLEVQHEYFMWLEEDGLIDGLYERSDIYVDEDYQEDEDYEDEDYGYYDEENEEDD